MLLFRLWYLDFHKRQKISKISKKQTPLLLVPFLMKYADPRIKYRCTAAWSLRRGCAIHILPWETWSDTPSGSINKSAHPLMRSKFEDSMHDGTARHRTHNVHPIHFIKFLGKKEWHWKNALCERNRQHICGYWQTRIHGMGVSIVSRCYFHIGDTQASLCPAYDYQWI